MVRSGGGERAKGMPRWAFKRGSVIRKKDAVKTSCSNSKACGRQEAEERGERQLTRGTKKS